MAASVVTVNEVLDGHVGLDIECLDRIYLNAYVPTLQVGGQVVTFFTRHRDKPIASPALFEQIGAAASAAGRGLRQGHSIPVLRFTRDDRKVDVMQPYLAAQPTSRSVVAIGVAQEFGRSWTGYPRESDRRRPQFTFAKADRRVTGFYFYVSDEDFGLGFIKICSYFPYPVKMWVNGHEWAKRQAAAAGIGLHRAVQRLRHLCDPTALAGHLRPAGAGTDRSASATAGWR